MEPLPCKRCGSSFIVRIYVLHEWSIACLCGEELREFDTEGEAIKEWNLHNLAAEIRDGSFFEVQHD